MKYLSKLFIVLLLSAGVSACSDFLNPAAPQNKKIDSINNVSDLNGLLVGAYDLLSQTELYGRNLIIYGDVRTPNAFSNGNSGRFNQLAVFVMEPTGDYAEVTWEGAYEVIKNCNLIIHSEVETSTKQEAKKLQSIKGQAYALRALTHSILLKLYGQAYVSESGLGVPYITQVATPESVFYPERPAVETTWQKIGQDYKKAINLLNPDEIGTPPADHTKINYYSALALQARYFLYTEQYKKASTSAKKVIDSGRYTLVSADNYLAAWGTDGEPNFLFGIAMTQTDNRGITGVSYIVNDTDYGDVEVTQELYKLYEDSDVRQDLYSVIQGQNRKHFRTNKYPTRYTDIPVIRYAEVILTYAEAQARLGNSATALTYLNKIPAHRNADLYLTASIENILLERRKELAMEGLYYWQLMRTGQSIKRDSMRPLVSAQEVTIPFGDYRLAFPIPRDEMDANPNFKQNEGY